MDLELMLNVVRLLERRPWRLSVWPYHGAVVFILNLLIYNCQTFGYCLVLLQELVNFLA